MPDAPRCIEMRALHCCLSDMMEARYCLFGEIERKKENKKFSIENLHDDMVVRQRNHLDAAAQIDCAALAGHPPFASVYK